MEAATAQAGQFTYKRHEPEKTLLYRVLAEHLETWLAERKADFARTHFPKFVERELRAFMRCGILEHGFILVACEGCGSSFPVAHSCKCRGFCPSCGAKRMSETAVHLIDNVLPYAPYRQWVVTFPHSLRFWLATSRQLTNIVHKIVTKMIMSYYVAIAEERGIKDPQPGGVTFLQRFGSALNLNVHGHLITLDGVFSNATGVPIFYHLPGPTDEEVSQVVLAIGDATINVLRKRGYLSEHATEVERPDCVDKAFADSEQLTAATSASNHFRIAFGEHAGEKVRRIGRGFGYEEEHGLVKGPQCASSNGFTVHANRYIGQQERKKLEDLIAYASRPAFSHKHLSLKDPDNPGGDLLYTLKKPWSDGTQAILLTQTELVEKLAALIPPPYVHLTRYFGVFSSHNAMRRRIILKPGVKKGFVTELGESGVEMMVRLSWSKLLARVFKIDVTRCKSCGAKIKPENCASFTSPPAIQAMLKLLGLQYHGPPIKPARRQICDPDIDQTPPAYDE
jgi:hypothetical protein